MALITRISKLFTADFHAVLDRIEEPEVLLRQAIREMEDEIASNEQRVKWLRNEHEQLQSRCDDVNATLPAIDDELDICFSAGKEELARSLIKRKLEAQRQLKTLGVKVKTTDKTLQDQQASLDENRSALEGLRQKAEILMEDNRDGAEGSAEFGDWRAGEFAVSEDDIEVAFLREKQRRKQS